MPLLKYVSIALSLMIAPAANAAEVSPAGQLAIATLSVKFGPEIRYLCGTFKAKVSFEGFHMGDPAAARAVKQWQYLEENGYVKKVGDGDIGFGGVDYAPTDKLWALASRREGDCFYYKSETRSNIHVVSEETHPTYKTVHLIYAAYNTERSKFEELLIAAQGRTLEAEVRVRFLIADDIYANNKPVVKAMDWGSAQGWLTNFVANLYQAVNMAGPMALERR